MRAAEELSSTDNIDPAIRRELPRLIANSNWELASIGGRYVQLLAVAGPEAIPSILHLIGGEKHGRLQRHVLLPALARMGSGARKAIPSLRQKLMVPGLDRNLAAAIRMTIAHIEGDPRVTAKLAHEFIAPDTDETGFPGFPLFCVLPHEWAEKRTIEVVAIPFTEKGIDARSGDNPYFSALFLGLSCEKGVPAKNVLEGAQKRALQKGDNLSVPITLALARIDPKNQDRYLRRLFKAKLVSLHALDRGMQAVLSEAPYLLIDTKLSIHLGQMIEDPDVLVADGAACLLWWAGLAGRAAFPRLKQFVQGTATPDRRARAANVLGRVATFARLRELEATLENEKATEVQRELKSAVAYIRLLGTAPEDRYFLKNRYVPPLSSRIR
jgi:hypothetical protein